MKKIFLFFIAFLLLLSIVNATPVSITLESVIPKPVTMLLFGLVLLGLIGGSRKEGKK